MRIIEALSNDARVAVMVEMHGRYCRQHTPAGSGHAVSGSATDLAPLVYWLALEGNRVLGCIALKPLDAGHAEIKTMHVRPPARGRGVGAALLGVLIREARDRGFSRLSLETGRSEGFAASRRLYERQGFAGCDPYGPYLQDPFSVCMTRRV